MTATSRYLVTGALPYANGRLHIGHVAGAYLPADICVRFLRLTGQDVAFICGSDENGVAITLSAAREGVSPQDIIDRYHTSIKQSFEGMGIAFDIYARTHNDQHAATAQGFFTRLLEAGYIDARETEQMYCPTCQMFLPDRYVEGTCHHCKTPGAKGDQCEACGKVTDAVKLLEPKCVICHSTTLEVRSTKHWFFLLDKLQPKLESFIHETNWCRDNVRRFSKGLLEQGLMPRSITRDIEWGVPVPLADAEGKVLYVWFDAPIGYLSFTKELFEQRGDPEGWRPYWQNEDTKILHFIGKDNIVFHSIIWPAMLMGEGEYQLPHDVVANEFLNIKGAKTSTSRNYAVWVEEYLEKFAPDPLRYYLTAIAPEGSDSDFSWEDFQARNNNELANNIGNFIQRNLAFCQKYFDGIVPDPGTLSESATTMLTCIEEARTDIAALLTAHKYKAALERLMRFAQSGNQFLEQEQPWMTRKTDMAACAQAVHIGLRVVEALSVLMAPFLPFSAAKLREMLCLPTLQDGAWGADWLLKTGHTIGTPEVLFKKFEDADIAAEAEVLAAKKSS